MDELRANNAVPRLRGVSTEDKEVDLKAPVISALELRNSTGDCNDARFFEILDLIWLLECLFSYV